MSLISDRLISNRILAALSEEDYRNLTTQAHEVSLRVGELLYEADQPIHSVYFMNAGICSVVTTMAEGASIEVMVVGREGIIGLPALESDSATTPTRAFMQVAGHAVKMNAAMVRREFTRPGKLQSLLLRQLQFTVAQISQTAACNRLHDLEERLSRWLLMVHDRLQTDKFLLTHDFLAQMLGTRRSSVTLAAGALQRAGLIEYRRGEMHISNRQGLEEAACECYPIVKASYDRFIRD